MFALASCSYFVTGATLTVVEDAFNGLYHLMDIAMAHRMVHNFGVGDLGPGHHKMGPTENLVLYQGPTYAQDWRLLI